MMRTLDSYNKNNEEKRMIHGVSVGEAVRNTTFYDILEELPDRQQEIYEIILKHSPDGISSIRIQDETGKPLHTFSGRISELANTKRKEKLPYCNPPLIVACGIDIHPDHNGRMRKYTKYKVVE